MTGRLSLFGNPRLLDGQGRIVDLPAKTFAVVAYLLLSNRGEPVSRAALRQFLWGNADAKTAAAESEEVPAARA